MVRARKTADFREIEFYVTHPNMITEKGWVYVSDLVFLTRRYNDEILVEVREW